MNISEIKRRAKEALNPVAWPTALITLVYAVLTGIISFNFKTDSFSFKYLLIALGASLLSIFVLNPLQVGYYRVMIAIKDGERPNFEMLFYAFTKNYMKSVSALFMSELPVIIVAIIYSFIIVLLIPLVSLGNAGNSIGTLIYVLLTFGFIIFLVPYSYSIIFVPILLADDREDFSNYTGWEVVQKSRKMLDGYKLDLFVLEISFFFWILLGIITFGIALLYVEPYMLTSITIFYDDLRE